MTAEIIEVDYSNFEPIHRAPVLYIHRPRINAGQQDLKIVTEKVWAAIRETNRPPQLFRYDGRIVRIVEEQGQAVISDVGRAEMNYELGQRVEFYRIVKGVEVPARPPADLATNFLATTSPPLPILKSLTLVPTFAPDGTLQCRSGYYKKTGTLYLPLEGLKIPEVAEAPDGDDLDEARHLICEEVLGDFPFVTDSDRAHAVAGLLLPFNRAIIAGHTPLHGFIKPTPGTGGTMLVQLLAFISTGKPASLITAPSDESEWRRTLFAVLREHPRVLLIDNADGEIKSATLAAAITAGQLDDRRVGSSEVESAPTECVWCLSGNNTSFEKALARRVIPIRLDARMEHPDQRSQFKHPDLEAWVKAHHGSLIWACLTIIQGWVAAGQPSGPRKLGGFEQWAGVIGGILEVAGISGFLDNVAAHRAESDRETQVWRAFVREWWAQYRSKDVSATELLGLAAELDLGDGDEHSRTSRLGRRLSEHQDQVFGEWTIRRGSIVRGRQQWRLRHIRATDSAPVDPTVNSGTAGTATTDSDRGEE